ncbi:MAG: hypothetical protein JXB26_10440 [Candidatus Aminicenantes bacterium]|nr:hypothetical protein [Candidatus Aminicenantes bacterium]
MSLESIINRILSDADGEAERIVEESRKKADEVLSMARAEADKAAELIFAEIERQARLEASRVLTKARLENRLALLSRKKEIVKEILKKAFSEQSQRWGGMKKEIIFKEEVKEETLDEKRLLDEIRPRVEGEIAKILKI